MISPLTDPASAKPPLSIREDTEHFFRPSGRLAKATAGEDFAYETRPQQREMALAVAEAMEEGHHLAVEAGTGVGKSFAYLVPLILAAKAKQSKVVVSTYTISLQEQLMFKDIPFLRAHLGVEFKAVLVKGRSNYLCLQRLAQARRMGSDLLNKSHERELERIKRWSERTEDGSLQDMEEQPSPEVWSLVCAEPGICVMDKAGHHKNCFFSRARSKMKEADVLVVNHHLFFSERSLRSQKAGFLPPYDIAVLDEAHQIEDVATEHLGLRLSNYAFEHWLSRLYSPKTHKGLLSYLKATEACQKAVRVWDAVELLFSSFRAWANFSEDETQRAVLRPLDIPTAVPELLAELAHQVRLFSEETENSELQAELSALYRRGVELRLELDAFMKQALPDQVYWVEKEGRRGQLTTLYSAPVEVASALKTSLFEELGTIIMTSATLAVRGDLSYFINRIGADGSQTLSVGSPFDYARQMRVYIAQGLPDPNDQEAFIPAAGRAIQQYLLRTRGRAFVLFTSSQMMKRVAERVRNFCEEEGLNLIVQGEGMPRRLMLDEFKSRAGSVLFGLDSFWTGVDVRGEALSNVIITRLPFAVPDQPVIKARLDRIRERGGDPFWEYSLPEAILKFRQGVGRLIRTTTDQGIIVVLDSRVLTKRYGKMFLDSIPECPVELVPV